jgi:hypothetical protein
MRPSFERRKGVSLARHPASTERVHLKWDRAGLADFVAGVRDIPPERRRVLQYRVPAFGSGATSRTA